MTACFINRGYTGSFFLVRTTFDLSSDSLALDCLKVLFLRPERRFIAARCPGSRFVKEIIRFLSPSELILADVR